MKKGFTIIEVIISISLILIVGVSTTFFFFKQKNKNELKIVTNKILEAANLYVKLEKDKNGNLYANEIISGAQGLQVPLSNLANAGYIDEELANKVYDSNPILNEDKDYYVLFVQEIGGENESYCNQNEITSYASWMPKGDNIYLCDKYNFNSNSIYEKIIKMDYRTNCEEDTSSLCYFYSGQKFDYVDKGESGNEPIWYFKGNVENNYLKFEGLEDKLYRIVRTTENSNIKIVSDDTIRISVYRSKGFYPLFLNAEKLYSIDGYKIKKVDVFYGAREGSYECSETENTTSWNDDKLVQCTSYWNEKYSVQSPIYTQIYLPLKNEYEQIKDVLEQYIYKDYNWCFSNNDESPAISFKCNGEKNVDSDFGLLNTFEYEYISLNPKTEAFIYGHYLGSDVCSDYKEIGLDNYKDFSTQNTTFFTNTFKNNELWNAASCSSGGSYEFLRPAYVIKGTSKVINGDGSKTNPYIIN